MKDVRENGHQEIERHDEIFKALANLTSAVNGLSDKVAKYEPMFEYYNKGNTVAKFFLGVLSYSSKITITVGAVIGSYWVIKQFFHGQN